MNLLKLDPGELLQDVGRDAAPVYVKYSVSKVSIWAKHGDLPMSPFHGLPIRTRIHLAIPQIPKRNGRAFARRGPMTLGSAALAILLWDERWMIEGG